jgi:hypothetical protein
MTAKYEQPGNDWLGFGVDWDRVLGRLFLVDASVVVAPGSNVKRTP